MHDCAVCTVSRSMGDGSSDEEHFWVIGHRGSPTREVENTLPSFERALEEGANGLELDLCVTADEQVVVWHDADPFESRARLRQLGLEPAVRYRPRVPSNKRLCRPVRDLTLAELQSNFGYAEGTFGGAVRAHIPTLDEFIAWASRRERLGVVFLDVKVLPEHADLLQILVRRLDEAVALHEPRFRVILETAHASVAATLARCCGPRYGHALDVEPHAGFVFDVDRYSSVRAAIEARLDYATPQRPRSITLFPFNIHRRIVAADVGRMRGHNRSAPEVPLVGLCPFTINDPSEMTQLVRLGAWGIQSDRPDVLHRVALDCGRLRA
jgi:glycerophosphoryl diester phosphodiesterase